MRTNLDKRPDSRTPTPLSWQTPFERITLFAVRCVAGHTVGGVLSERNFIPIVGDMLEAMLSSGAGLHHETTEAHAYSICCYGAVPGHYLGPHEDSNELVAGAMCTSVLSLRRAIIT